MNKVIKFGADWCGPCRAMKPQFEKFKTAVSELATPVELVDINIDQYHEEAEKCGVQSIPYTVFIKEGKVEESIRGMLSADELMKIYLRVYAN
jgi:thioredoxin 1